MVEEDKREQDQNTPNRQNKQRQDELRRKIKKSLDEGYSRDEILQVMKEQGYSKGEIGKALAHLTD